MQENRKGRIMITEIIKGKGKNNPFKKIHAAYTWVMRAVSTDSTRRILNYLYVDGKKLVATDGRRLHVSHDIFATENESGLYRILKRGPVIWLDKQQMKDTGTYPKYRRVIPTAGSHTEIVSRSGAGNDFMFRMAMAAHNVSGAVFCMDYIADAIPSGYKGDVKVVGTNKLSALVIHHDLGLAVLMPVRVN